MTPSPRTGTGRAEPSDEQKRRPIVESERYRAVACPLSEETQGIIIEERGVDALGEKCWTRLDYLTGGHDNPAVRACVELIMSIKDPR